MWFGATVRQGIGAAKRAGFAVSKRVRASLGKIEGASGVGDEEMDVKGGGSRAWWEDALDQAAQRVRDFLEKSSFVRIGKLEAWVRKKLGMPPRAVSQAAPAALPAGPKRRSAQAGRGSVPLDPEQAAKLRQQVQLLRTQANTSRGSAPSASASGVVPRASVAAAIEPEPAPVPASTAAEEATDAAARAFDDRTPVDG